MKKDRQTQQMFNDIKHVVNSNLGLNGKDEKYKHDTETAHKELDELLCKLLNHLGYGFIVKEYKRVEKWYA